MVSWFLKASEKSLTIQCHDKSNYLLSSTLERYEPNGASTWNNCWKSFSLNMGKIGRLASRAKGGAIQNHSCIRETKSEIMSGHSGGIENRFADTALASAINTQSE